jgi:hypothetical protein
VNGIKRRRLYVAPYGSKIFSETPYFVDTANRSYQRTYGQKHGLFGSGMHESGSAGTLGFGPHVATLKHKAEQLAMAQAERIQNGET